MVAVVVMAIAFEVAAVRVTSSSPPLLERKTKDGGGNEKGNTCRARQKLGQEGRGQHHRRVQAMPCHCEERLVKWDNGLLHWREG
ncbi:hypothetical protein F5148DRAFT_1249296, partial [Russula earlei]